jgi:hypothetical protein
MLQDPCTAGGLILAAGVAATVVAQQEMDYREYFPYGPTVLLEEEYTPLDNESPSDFVGPSRNNPLFDSTFKDPGFPLESSIPLVTTWTSSAQLDRNMQAANMPRPPDAAAHHIVAENDPRAALSRAILAGAGIDVNSADNGVYLPRNMNVPNPNNEAVHSRIHTDTYYREVERRLQVAQVAGRPITPVLQQIEQELLSDTFPYR